MIPGAMVTLCLCHLLGLNRSLGIVAAIGTVGVGLGGQETYGQTIGFLRTPETVAWGLTGLTIKGAMWGLSGGLVVGLGLMHTKYRLREIVVGLLVMIAGTVLGRLFIDEPKLAYFSHRLDQPREEVWVGVTVGAYALMVYLLWLRRETISTVFALVGLLAGGAGFGIGGACIAFGFTLPPPYRGWSWWKVMEFTFGALYGLGLGAVTYHFRLPLREPTTPMSESTPHRDPLEHASATTLTLLGSAIAVGGLWLNFTIPFRAPFSLVAPLLIMIALWSNRLAWHVALTMTISGFVRDFLKAGVERHWFDERLDDWLCVALVTLPIAATIAILQMKRRLTLMTALLGLTWLATLFGVIKVGLPHGGKGERVFVPTVFIVELLATTGLALAVRSKPEESG